MLARRFPLSVFYFPLLPQATSNPYAGSLGACLGSAVQPGESRVDFLRDFAIANFDPPWRDSCDLGIMCYQHNGPALGTETTKQVQNRFPSMRVEVACWLVRKDNPRIIHQCAGD